MIVEPFAGFALVAALLIDRFLIDPDRLWARLPHPVVGFGRIIEACERAKVGRWERASGVATVAVLLLVCAAIALVLATLPIVGGVLAALLAAVLLAQRSLDAHVERVAAGLERSLDDGRREVSMIVGRDVAGLDEAGVARAAIESLAENFSDGVVAPAFWFLVLGPFGILAYKAVNTADSMIGHRDARYLRFGWAAARLDDVLNLVPARLTALLLAVASPRMGLALRTAWRDARSHRSPNAGWPEAAMAGALDVALGGPRRYAEGAVDAPFLHEKGARAIGAAQIRRALALYRRALWLLLALVCGLVLTLALGMGDEVQDVLDHA